MTDKELTDKYRREQEELHEEIKKKEEEHKITVKKVVASTRCSADVESGDEHKITIKVVVTTRCSANEEKEEEKKEYDFVEEYLKGTTNPLLRWYREHRKKE